jgi:hypothetical protein
MAQRRGGSLGGRRWLGCGSNIEGDEDLIHALPTQRRECWSVAGGGL